MIECPKCSSPIPPERTRTYCTPKGVAWKTVAWCEACDHLHIMRRSANAVTWRFILETKSERVRAFVKTLKPKPEIQRRAS